MGIPAVSKVGGKWRGQVVSIGSEGNLITNFRSAEVAPLAGRSKVWFELQAYSGSVRGLKKDLSAADEGKPCAVEAPSGFIEIAVKDGSAAQVTGLKEGDSVVANFRT